MNYNDNDPYLKEIEKKIDCKFKNKYQGLFNQHPEYPDNFGKNFHHYDLSSAFENSSQNFNGFSCELERIEHPFRRIGGGVQIYLRVFWFGEASTQTSHHNFCYFL